MKKKIIQLFLLLILSLVNSWCFADDSELFVSNHGNANVLLLFNLTDLEGGGDYLEVTKAAVKTFLTETKNINIAIVSSEVNSSGITVPVVSSHFKPIDKARNELINIVEGFTSHSSKTIDSALLTTTWKYFAGESYYNNDIIIRDPTSQNGNKFISPIQNSCDKNFAFLFSRYLNHNDLADSYIVHILANRYSYPSKFDGYATPSLHIIGWLLGQHDVNTNIAGKQTVKVFVTTMPNRLNSDTLSNRRRIWDLNEIAKYTDGTHYNVDNPQGLIDAMADFKDIVERASILVSPVVSTDAFGFHTQDKKIYFALFKPEASSSWKGNLKCYKLGADGVIYDKNNNPAIDDTTGFFKATSHSFWSSVVDGNDVLKGGMAEHLSQDRKVYSDILETSYTHYANNSTPLSNLNNKLHEDNSNITTQMLDIQDLADPTATKKEILKWARGVDTRDINNNGNATDNRKSIGDSMHTKPLLVKYYDNDETIYLTTNDGFLHAVNPTNGNTIFSFIPRDLLPNLKIAISDTVQENKLYGLDAPMTALILDANDDGNILQSAGGAVSANEAALLVMPMRRGGRNIYSLNVSDRNNPKMAWTIRGGKNSDQQTTKLTQNVGIGDFTKLGQTWSTAMPAKIKWQGSTKIVFFFGGGYDEQTDNQTAIQTNNMGNAIFMVDAITGKKLWQASGNSNNGTDLVIYGMNYSIVSNLALVDITQDGFTDFIIATDVGGQVFRIDLYKNSFAPSSFAAGSLIAQLSDGSSEGSRRFFEAANISLAPNKTHLNIAIGSGFRANPQSTYTQDRIYVIKDKNVFSKPTNYAYANRATGSFITESNLYNATENLIQSGTTAQKLAATNSLKDAHGWYINLEQTGEKLFSKLQTYAGVLTFTTYTPPDVLTSDNCQPNLGSSSLYVLNIENGSAVANLTGGSSLGKNDRKKQLKLIIAPEPSIINRGRDGIRVCVGTECFDDIISGGVSSIKKAYWRSSWSN